MIREIGKLLFQAKSYWIFCHENPDGDTLGCSLATYGVLVQSKKDVKLFSQDPIPRMYSFLPMAEAFDDSGELPSGVPDIIVVNDNAAFERLGVGIADQLTERGIGPFARNKHPDCTLINLDHHVSNEMYGDINVIDPSCGACGELIYYIFNALKFPITVDVAINLYAAIMTDTGRFSYGNTSQQTFNIASDLIRIGVSPFEVVNRVYNTRTPGQIKLMARVLDTITVEPGLGYFYCYVTQEMLSDAGTVLSDTEGVVDLMKSVGDFDMCIFFKEEPDGLVKISARSNAGFDVNEIARQFGGGGHPAAAGFRMKTTILEAPEKFAQAMRELKQAQNDPNSQEPDPNEAP